MSNSSLVRDVAEQRAGLDGDGVRRVRPDLCAVRREVEAIAEVLLERAAERHVDHLQSATGAEHGHAALTGEPVRAISSSSRTRSGLSFEGCASLA